MASSSSSSCGATEGAEKPFVVLPVLDIYRPGGSLIYIYTIISAGMEIFMQSSYMCLAVYICGRWNGSSALLGVSDGRLGGWLRVRFSRSLETVWHCACNCVSSNFEIFFLLKLSAVCTFWIVLMCWCQKWFLKNEKTSLACISARKAIWKATTTTLPNTLESRIYIWQAACDNKRKIRTWLD